MTDDDAYSAMQGACACKTIWWFWRAPVLFPSARFIAKVEDDSALHDARLVAELRWLAVSGPAPHVWFSHFQWAGADPSSVENSWFCGDGDQHMAGKGAAISCAQPGAVLRRHGTAAHRDHRVVSLWGHQSRHVFPFASGGLDVRSRALVDALRECGDAMEYAHAWSLMGAHCGCEASRGRCDPDEWAAACDGVQGHFVARCMWRRRLQNVTAFHLTLRKFYASSSGRPPRDATVMHPYKRKARPGRTSEKAWEWPVGLAMLPMRFTLYPSASGVRWEAANPAAVRRWYAADRSKEAWPRACDDGVIACAALPRELTASS